MRQKAGEEPGNEATASLDSRVLLVVSLQLATMTSYTANTSNSQNFTKSTKLRNMYYQAMRTLTHPLVVKLLEVIELQGTGQVLREKEKERVENLD